MIISSRKVVRITAAVLVATLCGACGTGRRDAVAEPPQEATPSASAAPQHENRASTPDGSVVLPWVAAVVARDDTSITVATGIDSANCGEPTRSPEATITHQDETQVVISVTTSTVRAEEEACATTGDAAPAFVSLQKPLGDRVLRDATTTRPHPTYFQRDVPDVLADKRWDPSGGHLRPDERWFQSFRDPGGTTLLLDAQPTTRVHRPATVATVPIRSQQGIITTYGAPGSWTVWWELGQVTYSLSLVPPDSHGFTLKQFKQQLAGLSWS
ncbi:hypothetical protein AB0K35_16060 [Micromonospora sp. NPDC053740]|uniref:hypothetical protein n=1 Tax=Micromonospora sp. NPDC053740 TaxID=3155173 RepID=UPI0034150411